MDKKKLTLYELLIGIMLVLFLIITVAVYKYKSHQVEAVDPELIVEVSVDYSKINKDTNHYTYEDDNYYSMFGIDVSDWQDEIDWKKVKEDGVEFVFIRIGRRGATTGLLYEDSMFERNYKEAKENGLLIGVYFFSQAITDEEAREEADWVAEHLKGKQIDLPVAYDCEEVIMEGELSRMIYMDKEHLTRHARIFCDRMKKHGYDTCIYTNQFWAENLYIMEELLDHPIWFAQYDVDIPKMPYAFTIWQYDSNGTIDGISHPTDLNIMFIEKEESE